MGIGFSTPLIFQLFAILSKKKKERNKTEFVEILSLILPPTQFWRLNI